MLPLRINPVLLFTTYGSVKGGSFSEDPSYYFMLRYQILSYSLRTLNGVHINYVIYCARNVVAHGDAWEGKWRGNWRMEWVASTLTRLRNVVYPALLTLMRIPRLPAVDWTDAPADLYGFVRLGERRNVVSARVPSGFARALPTAKFSLSVSLGSTIFRTS